MEYKETHITNKLEKEFWWHQHLYSKVFIEIRNQFGQNRDIYILDCGCGSGGLLEFLKEKGYNNIYGFDLSSEAASLCQSKGLKVECASLLEINSIFYSLKFDVLISLDSLYFISDDKKEVFFIESKSRVNKGSIFIINLPAFEILRGNHDRIAQIPYRYTKSKFLSKFKTNSKSVKRTTYWPFFLSPIIFFTRLLQRIQLAINPNLEIKSDISELPSFVNLAFKKFCDLENKLIKSTFFGSSLFIVQKLDE